MSLLSFFRSAKRTLRRAGVNRNLVFFDTNKRGFPWEKHTMGFESPKVIAINKNLVYASPAKAKVILKHEMAHAVRDRYPYKDKADTHDDLFNGISFLMGGNVGENVNYYVGRKYYNFICPTCGFRYEGIPKSHIRSPPYCPDCEEKYGMKKRLVMNVVKHPAIGEIE